MKNFINGLFLAAAAALLFLFIVSISSCGTSYHMPNSWVEISMDSTIEYKIEFELQDYHDVSYSQWFKKWSNQEEIKWNNDQYYWSDASFSTHLGDLRTFYRQDRSQVNHLLKELQTHYQSEYVLPAQAAALKNSDSIPYQFEAWFWNHVGPTIIIYHYPTKSYEWWYWNGAGFTKGEG
jgi:hypothetical protein